MSCTCTHKQPNKTIPGHCHAFLTGIEIPPPHPRIPAPLPDRDRNGARLAGIETRPPKPPPGGARRTTKPQPRPPWQPRSPRPPPRPSRPPPRPSPCRPRIQTGELEEGFVCKCLEWSWIVEDGKRCTDFWGKSLVLFGRGVCSRKSTRDLTLAKRCNDRPATARHFITQTIFYRLT